MYNVQTELSSARDMPKNISRQQDAYRTLKVVFYDFPVIENDFQCSVCILLTRDVKSIFSMTSSTVTRVVIKQVRFSHTFTVSLTTKTWR